MPTIKEIEKELAYRVEKIKGAFKPEVNKEGKRLVFSLEKFLSEREYLEDQCHDSWEYVCNGKAVGIIDLEEPRYKDAYVCIVDNVIYRVVIDWCIYV